MYLYKQEFVSLPTGIAKNAKNQHLPSFIHIIGIIYLFYLISIIVDYELKLSTYRRPTVR